MLCLSYNIHNKQNDRSRIVNNNNKTTRNKKPLIHKIDASNILLMISIKHVKTHPVSLIVSNNLFYETFIPSDYNISGKLPCVIWQLGLLLTR